MYTQQAISTLPAARDPECELASRCITAATRGGAQAEVTDIPTEVLTGLDAELAALDPAAGMDLFIACPACGSTWLAPFNVVDFFWAELNSWARRMLRDVHDLARAYGWCQEDILALNPQRRRAYLELVRS